MAAKAKTSTRDFTGRQREKLQAEHAEELAKREAELSTAHEAERVANETEVIDHTNPALPDVIVDETIALGDDEDDEDMVVFRVNEDLENVTIGVGNVYDFKAGPKHRAPRHVYQHLDEKGLVWH